MPKTETKAKRWTRKPLSDVSNGAKLCKSMKNNNKNKATVEDDDDATHLDRLLLAHSDLSSVFKQIDELVAEALKFPRKIGRKEIESFTQVLSEIQSTLKPWPLRFQKALSTHCNSSENHLDQSFKSGAIHHDSKDTSNVVQSPEECKLNSLISPSPLVTWHGECNVDGGRQLFLLTPLPRPKAFASNPRGLLRSPLEKIKSDTDNGLQSFIAVSNDIKNDLPDGKEIEPTPAKVSEFVENKRESTIEPEIISPPKFSQKDFPMLVFTPRMKMSPPKSCVLLEPISELNHKSFCGVRKSTPFPVGLQGLSSSESSESSSGGESHDLALKYPELYGIRPTHKLGIGRKGIEASPKWFMSPPKSCVLMEPSDDKQLTDAIKNCQLSKTDFVPDQLKNMTQEKGEYDENKFSGRVVESTPLFKEPKSTLRADKFPGENTLKKELWTKFEAASTKAFRVGVPVLQTDQKGFLDRLEEVSFEETKSAI